VTLANADFHFSTFTLFLQFKLPYNHMFELCAIASGSNGNCYYIGNQHEAVLVDAGLSARRIVARMRLRNLDPTKVKAIIISHEHADHVSGARVLGKRLRIPVYLTSQTYMAMYALHQPIAPRFFLPGSEIRIGSFKVHTFSKNHDAAEPCSFRIEYNGMHVGVFTDIGSPCEHVIHHFKKCHAIYLETNYDEKMLWEGSYPWPLKKRIASDLGHMSNDQAFNLLAEHSGDQLRLIFLSHLSAENNRPEIARLRFSEFDDRFAIHLTSRYEAGEVFYME
jgi:phosphoribosyl 1,2-cyclic phosphodiesterase